MYPEVFKGFWALGLQAVGPRESNPNYELHREASSEPCVCKKMCVSAVKCSAGASAFLGQFSVGGAVLSSTTSAVIGFSALRGTAQAHLITGQ